METDFVLQLLGFQPCEHLDTVTSVRYLCNLTYSDVLDVSKNQKFPGTMVVSLSREHLPLLRGQPSSHLPYKPTDLWPWLEAMERPVPPLVGLGAANHGGRALAPSPPVVVSCRLPVEFGAAGGTLEFFTPVYLAVNDVDFGTSDGLFLVIEDQFVRQ